jgi:serine/threonine protein kinase
LQDGEFMMVMQYASFGDLRLHLQRNRISSWKDKIRILKQIARGIAEMHKRDLIHGDLHCGNVMNIDQSHFVIGDVGLCGPANRMTRKKGGVYGVLPYVAPELLRGSEYSKKVDIYSFAMIMWEICSGIRPYAGTAHDLSMAKDICEGKRPPVPPGTPSFYSELMKSCWDANPNNRPDAPEVLKTVYHWLVNDSLDEYLRKGGSTILFNNTNNLTHPEAVYYSRLLDFPELKERKQVLSSRGPEYTTNLQNFSVEENNNNSLRPPLIQERSTQSFRGSNSQLKLRSSRETLESKLSQSTYNSKQSRSLNKPQDTSNSKLIPSKSSQRTSGKASQRKYNSSSPKPPNYSRPSQISSYSSSQSTLKTPQRSPMSPSQFYESVRSVKSDDNVSINSKAFENPLSVVIPDDDIVTLTSFWSMDGPNR